MNRIGWPALLLACSACSAGCAPGAEVLFDVHTDLMPGREFDEVHVGVAETDQTTDAATDGAWVMGVRLGPLTAPVGRQRLVAELLLDGRVVVSRNLNLSLSGTAVVPVYLLRSCVNVECPGTGNRELTECEDGRCVLPTCIDGIDCPPPVCITTPDCPVAPVACAESRCFEGHCLITTPSGGCSVGFACDLVDGCVPSTLPTDAGVRDTGGFDVPPPDVPPVDAPTDGAIDTGRDVPATGCMGACNDGDPCTYGDRCVAGRCEGTAISCVSDECVDRSCDGTSACAETIRVGRACTDDGNECTDDRCGAGGNCRHYDLDGASCGSGICCVGSCVPQNTSNCGACGARCGSGESCSGGRCVCGGTAGGVGSGAACGGSNPACCSVSCADLDSDPLHCGACTAPRCGDQWGDCIGGTCFCGSDGRCSGVSVSCCRCGPGGMGSYCEAPGLCPC